MQQLNSIGALLRRWRNIFAKKFVICSSSSRIFFRIMKIIAIFPMTLNAASFYLSADFATAFAWTVGKDPIWAEEILLGVQNMNIDIESSRWEIYIKPIVYWSWSADGRLPASSHLQRILIRLICMMILQKYVTRTGTS